MKVRPAAPADHRAIDALVQAAFGRSEEARIVRGVRAEGAALIELVAEDASEMVGHVLFSRMTCDPRRRVAGLGPLAVTPKRQRQGAGSRLAEAGIEACRALGVEAIVVLGHPTYYPRFGFSADAARAIASPYAGLPAFMAMALRPGALEGPLSVAYPAAFS